MKIIITKCNNNNNNNNNIRISSKISSINLQHIQLKTLTTTAVKTKTIIEKKI